MIAMVQHNLKKLLSYHAISQVGYMVLGIATGTTVGLVGGVFHMINHAIYKCCLFLCGGAVEKNAGTAELEELGGLGKKMPITFACCTIAALSISGVPPFNGFVSKWMVYQGVITMGAGEGSVATLWPVWFTAAMFGSALTLASFVKVIHSVFLSRQRDALTEVKETSALQWIPMAILATLCVVLGVFYKNILGWFIYPALQLEGGQVPLSDWQSVLATILLVVGLIIGFLIWLLGKGAIKVREVPTWYCGEAIDNEKMVIPGTHFYKTVSRMGGLKQLYSKQEKGWFDLYDQAGRVGLTITELLQRLHNGILPRYLTWVTLGLLLIIYTVCKKIW
jgi:formate hydrogenlyase subunit 3/multisubunit Na+/H+ antiporter MnhD subunit